MPSAINERADNSVYYFAAHAANRATDGEAEFRAIYDSAEFKLTKIVPTPARLSVIEGVLA